MQSRFRENESYILDRESFKAFQAICCHSLLPCRFGRIGSCVARAGTGRYVLAGSSLPGIRQHIPLLDNPFLRPGKHRPIISGTNRMATIPWKKQKYH